MISEEGSHRSLACLRKINAQEYDWFEAFLDEMSSIVEDRYTAHLAHDVKLILNIQKGIELANAATQRPARHCANRYWNEL